MKKIVTAVATTSLLMANALSVSAQAPDLSALAGSGSGGTTTTTTTTESGSTNTATNNTSTNTAEEIATVKIIPSLPNVEAGSTTPVEVIVLVETKTAKKLSDQDITLTASVLNSDNGSMGTFTGGEYSPADQYFKFQYTPGKTAGTAQLSVKATSKTNPKNEVTETTAIVVSPSNGNGATTSTPATTDKETNTGLLSDDNFIEKAVNVNSSGATADATTKTTEKVTDAIKITKTEVLDLNRIKISFDHKIALGDNPLEMISIETVKNKTPLEISNITLGSDEKSLIVLTKEPLAKEEYHVTVKTVINGETMKAVTVANGVATVSGMPTALLALMGVLSAIGAVFLSRKRKA